MVLLLVVGVLLGWPVWTFFSNRAGYLEAEPLVQTVWPMAHAMQEFEKKKGRGPATLEELAAYDPSLNMTALDGFDVTLNPTGNPRLFLRVNRRYHYLIDDVYAPSFEQTSEDPSSGR